jgi:hypothetical protein
MARHLTVGFSFPSSRAKKRLTRATVTLADLQACDPLGKGVETDAQAALKRNLEKVNLTHVRALFNGKKLAFSTSLIMVVWAFIG